MHKPTIREFFASVSAHWGSLVSGALSVPFTVLALWAKADYVKAIWGALALIAVLVTVYQIWAIERAQVISLQSELEKERDRSKPKFSPRIDLVLPDEIPPQEKKPGTAVLVVASITNTGAPSVAGHWRLTVHIPELASFILEPSVLPTEIKIAPPGGNRSTVIDRSNALYDKVARLPIATGARESGALWFLAPGVNMQDMRRIGTRYCLTFEDCNEKEWLAELLINAPGSPELKYYPGVNSPPEPVEGKK